MKKRAVMGFLLWATLATGCDGDDKKSGPNPTTLDTTRPAPEQCRTVAQTICARERSCLMTAPSVPCQFNLDQEGLCARAEAAAANASACHGDLQALSCASLFPGGDLSLPSSCNGSFTFAKGMGEMQCEALATATCQRLVECAEEPVAPAEQATEVAACQAALADVLDCFSVTGVSATYPACLQRTQTEACAAFDEGFPECAGVLQ